MTRAQLKAEVLSLPEQDRAEIALDLDGFRQARHGGRDAGFDAGRRRLTQLEARRASW